MTTSRLAGSTHSRSSRSRSGYLTGGGFSSGRFQELGISGAPYTSFPSEGEGPQTVRQVTALLGHLDTIHIGSLKPSACGCFISGAPGSLITFCKGSCALDEDDGVSKCVECGTALSTRRLRFGEELFAVGIKDTEHAGGEEGGVTGMGKVCLGTTLSGTELLLAAKS